MSRILPGPRKATRAIPTGGAASPRKIKPVRARQCPPSAGFALANPISPSKVPTTVSNSDFLFRELLAKCARSISLHRLPRWYLFLEWSQTGNESVKEKGRKRRHRASHNCKNQFFCKLRVSQCNSTANYFTQPIVRTAQLVSQPPPQDAEQRIPEKGNQIRSHAGLELLRISRP